MTSLFFKHVSFITKTCLLNKHVYFKFQWDDWKRLMLTIAQKANSFKAYRNFSLCNIEIVHSNSTFFLEISFLQPSGSCIYYVTKSNPLSHSISVLQHSTTNPLPSFLQPPSPSLPPLLSWQIIQYKPNVFAVSKVWKFMKITLSVPVTMTSYCAGDIKASCVQGKVEERWIINKGMF